MNIAILINGPRGVHVIKNLKQINFIHIKSIVYSQKNKKKYFLKSIKKFRKNLNFFKDINSKKTEKFLHSLDLDLILIAGYSQILKGNILKLAKKFVINLHGGPVNKYRGGSPLNWQIINGEKNIGISLIKTDSGIDTGGIISEKYFKLEYKDTIREVHLKANKLFSAMINKILKKIKFNQDIKIKYQKKKGAYHFQRNDKDGEIKFKSMKSKDIYNFVRAITHPYPGAWAYTNLDNKRKKIRVYECEVKKRIKNILKKDFFMINKKLYAKTLDHSVLLKKYAKYTEK